MKTIAAICMLIDHIGMLFYPEELAWRAIGRLAMPIFAYCLARGILHTSSLPRYMRRLAGFAVVSQIPFWLFRRAALGGPFLTLNLNIGFTLLTGAGVILLVEKVRVAQGLGASKGKRLLMMVGAQLLLIIADLLSMDYGSYGILVIASCYYVQKTGKPMGFLLIFYTILTALCFCNMSIFLLQEVGVLGLVIGYELRNVSEKRMGRFFYIFYPVHLLILVGGKWLL